MLRIEFAITLRCNTKCHCCSRHSQLHGFESDISMEQLDRFIKEVKEHGNVDVIWMTGGEPTVHPNFNEIMSKLYKDLLCAKIINRLILVSNDSNIVSVPDGVEITILAPSKKLMNFRCQYVAPYDSGQRTKQCKVPYTDGVGFSAYGWYPCGGGSAICMVFNLMQYRRSTIPKDADDFPDRNVMCNLCQVSAEKWMMVADYGDIKSRSFRKAFRNFKRERLERY